MIAVRPFVLGGLLTLGLTLPAFAQLYPPALRAEADHAVFVGDTARTLEIYLGFPADALQFRADTAGYRATIGVAVEIDPVGAAGEVAQLGSTLSFVAPDTAALRPGQQFLQVLRTSVGPGSYALRIRMQPESGQAVLLERSLDVPESVPSTTLSDVILASDLRPDDGRPAVLSKNGVRLAPNPGLLFGKGVDALHYYVELYGPATTDSLTTYTRVVPGGRQNAVAGFERSQSVPARSAQVIVGAFNAGLLPSGSYEWMMDVTNAAGELVAQNSKKFFVYNPDLQTQPARTTAASSRNPDDTLFMIMAEEELDHLIEQMRVIATKDERRRLRRAKTLEQRREATVVFWRRRDPDPVTPRNEFKEEFDMRLEYVRERFETPNREGWRTDRGEVVLRYGIPDNVENRLNQNDTVPHSIWTYTNIPRAGRAIFVFADRSGFDSFELIHSDAPGEPRNPNWQAELISRR